MDCTYDPTNDEGGMFHCPECGDMVIAGLKHPDYNIQFVGPTILLIDDMRTSETPSVQHLIGEARLISEDVMLAPTFGDAMDLLLEADWKLVLFDHDLGDLASREKTGYDVLCWLEANPEHLPEMAGLVTSNPVGRKKMATVLDKLMERKGNLWIRKPATSLHLLSTLPTPSTELK